MSFHTTVPNSLREFLKGVPTRAVPKKVTNEYLRTIGMKSSNDRTIIPVLKKIGLLDTAGVPTDEFSSFTTRTKGPVILAELIRKAYADLYSTYDDSHNQKDEVLSDYFREKTKMSPRVVKLLVATFKVLCEFADFSTTTETKERKETGRAEVMAAATPGYPSIHLTLQIHLPESKDPTVYDSIFQALSKYLLKGT